MSKILQDSPGFGKATSLFFDGNEIKNREVDQESIVVSGITFNNNVLSTTNNNNIVLSPGGTGEIITTVTNPTNPNALAPVTYVNNTVFNTSSYKLPVKLVSTSALVDPYTASGSGVGKTLTKTSNGAFPAIDGVTLTQDQRLLLINEASSVNNGIYTLSTVGSGAAPWVLTRSTDADGDEDNEVTNGIVTFSEPGGTLTGGSGYVLQTAISPFTVDTDPQIWVQFNKSLSETTGGGGGNSVITATSTFLGTNVGSNDSRNTFIGAEAGGSAGDDSVCIGYNAGNVLNAGTQNTLIGSQAGATVSTGDGCVCIGYFSGGTFTTQTNLLSIANGSTKSLIGGEFNNNNVGLCLTGNVGSYASGQGVVFIQDRAAAPSGNPTGGSLLFSESGVLKYLGTSGSALTIADSSSAWKTPDTDTGTFSATNGAVVTSGTITVEIKLQFDVLYINFNAEGRFTSSGSPFVVSLEIDDSLFAGKTLGVPISGVCSIQQGNGAFGNGNYNTGHLDLSRNGDAIVINIRSGIHDVSPGNFNTIKANLTVKLA